MEKIELTKEEQEHIDRLNKYSEKCKKINKATCWETDKEVAESIKNCSKLDKNNDKLFIEASKNLQKHLQSNEIEDEPARQI